MTANEVRQEFINHLHQRSREYFNIYSLVGNRFWDKKSYYLRARLGVLERLFDFEEWDEN